MKPYNPVDVCHHCNDRMYEYLKQKIQEKIESLQSEIKGDHFEDCDSGHDFETHQNIEFAIEQLKSLFENE